MVEVDSEASGVLCQARGEHVRQYSGHDCGPEHVVKALETSFNKTEIHVVEEVVDILHCHLEVLQSKAKWQLGIPVEASRFNHVSQ
jgi:hypothetical protein